MCSLNPHPFVITLATLGLLAVAGRSEERAAALTLAEFEQLHNQLDLKKQPWATIPWKVSVTEARQVAAREKKPIFLVVNTGNCLGFV